MTGSTSRRPTTSVLSEIGDGSLTSAYEAISKCRNEIGSSLFSRNWVQPTDAVSGSATGKAFSRGRIRVMQFNLLAEGLSARETDVPPFEAQFKSDGGGFDKVPLEVLDFSRRKFLLLEKIFAVDADIVALEECDHYFDFFLPIMKLKGYDGVFTEKKFSPCLRFGYYSDGVALFFKTDVLRLEESWHYTGDSSGPPCAHAVTRLTHLASGAPAVVGATHLKSKISVACEKIRLEQVRSLLPGIAKLYASAEKQQHQNQNSGILAPSPVVIILGDFNTAPVEEKSVAPLVIPYMLGLSASAPEESLLFPFAPLKSAYPLTLPYTTCKIRGDYRSMHTIDYIWHSTSNSAVEQVLEMPAIKMLDPNVLLPCPEHPSDHFDLAADIIF